MDAFAPVMLLTGLSISPIVIINEVSFVSLGKVVMAENYKEWRLASKVIHTLNTLILSLFKAILTESSLAD
jgi:hypothetical protein